MLTETSALGEEPAAKSTLEQLRERMYTFDAMDEQVVMAALLKEAVLDPEQLKTTQALAAKLAQGVRKARLDAGGVDLLTQEFTLDSREGVALMCLAEAMLRVPDTATRNKLIRDKIVDQDWKSHIGQSPSLFVNAAAWGLALTGKVLKQPDERALSAALTNLLRRGGEGVVRTGVSFAMRLLGKQFVTGQTIEEAISSARSREKIGYRYSYDMLGEGALTPEDANAYYEAYAHTIDMVGRAASGLGTIEGPGVSVKLTGLHPRYEVSQHERVLDEMYPKLRSLAIAAKRWDIGFHLDQEEAARFPLTLEMLERLAHEPELAGWEGLGISLQAYQKRCLAVADWLIALGRATNRRILVRLVKGAYWDTEIKRCQSEGADGFPVFTRKVHSDVAYLACTKKLLNAPDAIFPQFATHNAFSIAAAYTLGKGKPYEFQCLHGMGESVYDQIVGDHQLGRACRVYAPVGPHATLLAYLVRRLLENGANTSFVNQVVDPSITIEQMVEDPVAKAGRTGGKAHPGVAQPRALLPWRMGASAAGVMSFDHVTSSVDTIQPGFGKADASTAFDLAIQAAPIWDKRPQRERAQVLVTVAQRLEAGVAGLQKTLLNETSLTLAEAGEELRSAADMCRFHASQALADGGLETARPLGPVVVLSPSTSPLSWPAAQAAAALVTGNCVIVKPSSLAPRTAMAMAQVFHACGVPSQALQVVPGDGETLGAALVAHPMAAAVVLGGSRATVGIVKRRLAELGRSIPLLARATGCNAMVVDSTSLPEQVITDVVVGAFDGGGRRDGSLKVLCLQDVVADKILDMLKAMLDERRIGSPLAVSSDIGPLLDPNTCQAFERHLDRLTQQGYQVIRGGRLAKDERGQCVQAAIVDLGSFDFIDGNDMDVVGPILHVVRWSAGELPELLEVLRRRVDPAVLGLHTRIYETAGEVISSTATGSIRVNRGIHLSRPGMQVEGISNIDIGPSPTGPFYLREFVCDVRSALERDRGPFSQRQTRPSTSFMEYPVKAGTRWTSRQAHEDQKFAEREELLQRMSSLTPMGSTPEDVRQQYGLARAIAKSIGAMSMPALSGEENTLLFAPRGVAYCAGPSPQGLLWQVMCAVACGNRVLIPRSLSAERILQMLGSRWCQLHDPAAAALDIGETPDTMLSEEQESVRRVREQLRRSGRGADQGLSVLMADRTGQYAWWRLLKEQHIAINVSASGGNAELTTMVEDFA